MRIQCDIYKAGRVQCEFTFKSVFRRMAISALVVIFFFFSPVLVRLGKPASTGLRPAAGE